jgi:hypothetical protein
LRRWGEEASAPPALWLAGQVPAQALAALVDALLVAGCTSTLAGASGTRQTE